jgi:hypothetical protein
LYDVCTAFEVAPVVILLCAMSARELRMNGLGAVPLQKEMAVAIRS